MGLDKNIARVEKLDEHTVKFTLNEVDAAFIQNLAMPFPSIQSAEYAAQLLKQGKASDINQKPIGTGPFVFSRYQKDAQIRFKGNKDYWITDMGLDKNIARVEKLDEHRVKFTLNEVDAAFIQNLAMDVASIQSAEYAGQLLEAGKPQQINQKPIGTGPFILSRYQKDAQIRFKGNKDYWSDALGKGDWFSELFALSGLAWAVAEIMVVKINLSPFP